MGNLQERATDLDSLELLIEKLGDVEKQAEVTLRKAKYAGSTSDYSKAIAAAIQAALLAWEAGNNELTASAQTEWGRGLAFTGNLDQARLHLIKALELARNAHSATSAQSSWLKIEAGSLNYLGYISNIQGDHNASSAYLEQALQINRQIRDRRGEGVMLQNLGVVSYDQGDFVNAEKYWVKALRIFQEIGDRQHEAMVLTSLGNISSDLLGDYTESQNRYEQALVIAQEVGDRQNEAMALGNIGLAAIHQQEFKYASDFIKRALAIYLEIGLKPNLGRVYRTLGEAYVGLKHLDAAIEAYQEAIQYAKELEQYDPILEAHAGLARIAQMKGDSEGAQFQMDTVLSQLEDDQILSQLEPEATLRIYLASYQVLEANQRPRANQIISHAYTLLQEQAAKISDEITRQMFLENIPWHRGIVEHYQNKHV
jgi:tetratricopeptide (TPR) repeat protein